MGRVAEVLQESTLAAQVRFDESLAPFSTYRVGGEAEVFLAVDDIDQLVELAVIVSAHELPVLVVGRGSNLLVSDAGFAGIAIVLGEPFAAVHIDTGHSVAAGGAARLPVVARQTVTAGLTGFEWAVGVPGSIGGGTRMNAGGHGSDMAASVVGATIVDLQAGLAAEWSPDELAFGYRSSAVQSHHVVVQVQLELEAGDPVAGETELAEIVRWRRANQPGGQNAGSVFTNPPDDSAGRLIDAAGCKGLRVGTAEVSTKHANFIQADPDGSADDVLALMREVARRVEDHGGVTLHPETIVVGFEAGRA